MTLILIAALNHKRVIGTEGRLPWHISEDLKRFRRLTMGHTVLMGRKTFESIGRALSGRRNVVLTHHAIPGIETYASLEAALEALKNEENVFVIGGGELYRQTLPIADRLCLTHVESDADGDTYFPPYESLIEKRFRLEAEEPHDGFTFRDYRRI
ncbi:MAG: dihydrofolate reductase [Acidobacteriota bacterium]